VCAVVRELRSGKPQRVQVRGRGASFAKVAAHEVRKVVTVVFCDVVGSTALGESTDPEALRAVLARYFERMSGVVERHGGTVEKFIGDAVVAVFGVPVVLEDDALRACRATGRANPGKTRSIPRSSGSVPGARLPASPGSVAVEVDQPRCDVRRAVSGHQSITSALIGRRGSARASRAASG
jgi:hypothetical protein